MYVILTVNLPFYSEDEAELKEMIEAGIFNKKHPGYKRLSHDAKNLIKWMLKVDPAE